MAKLAFNERDAAHVYEWLIGLMPCDPELFAACAICFALKERLERFLGPAEVRRIKRIVKKNPYYM